MDHLITAARPQQRRWREDVAAFATHIDLELVDITLVPDCYLFGVGVEKVLPARRRFDGEGFRQPTIPTFEGLQACPADAILDVHVHGEEAGGCPRGHPHVGIGMSREHRLDPLDVVRRIKAAMRAGKRLLVPSNWEDVPSEPFGQPHGCGGAIGGQIGKATHCRTGDRGGRGVHRSTLPAIKKRSRSAIS